MSPFAVTAIVIALSAVFPAQANAWQERIEATYQLSELDSVSMARKVVFQKIIQKAQRQLGIFIMGSTRLQSDQVTENIEMVTAGAVVFDNVAEHLSIESGVVQLQIVADVYIDEADTEARIEQLLKSEQKADAISKLSEQNRKLRAQLLQLLKDGHSQHSDKTYLDEQEELFGLLSQTTTEAVQVFDTGELHDLSVMEGKRLDRVVTDLKAGLLETITDGRIELKIVQAVKVAPDRHRLVVTLDWLASKPKLIKLLSKYLLVPNYDDRNNLLGVYSKDVDSQGTESSRNLFKQLLQQSLNIEVSIGNKTESVPVIYTGADFFTDVKNQCRNPMRPEHAVGNSGATLCAKVEPLLPAKVTFQLTTREMKDVQTATAKVVWR